ncbi:unnamed protein product [Ambrosiozyma monospora]|uniref:Unnamed protein product n=1 Tax=Ambrosiozyma monospora TaxID=43982 RepID=A0ACB5SUE3_AMBMO|nr:unnamed protein product [Ambrosiozyma monospora]
MLSLKAKSSLETKLESEEQDFSERIEALKEKTSKFEKSSETVKEEIEALKSTVSEKEKEITKLKAKLDKVDPEVEKKLAEANKKLAKLKSDNESLQRSVTRAGEKVDELQKTLKSKDSDMAALKREISSSKTQVSDYEKTKKKLTELKKSLEEKSAIAADSESVKRELEQVQKSLDEVNSKLEEQSKELEEKTAIANAAEKLKLKYKQLKHDFKENKQLMEAKIRDEVEFNRGKKAHQMELQDLKDKLNAIEKELQMEKRINDGLSVQVKSMKDENESLQKSNRSSGGSSSYFRAAAAANINLPTDVVQLREELVLLKTRLASEAFENRQLRAQLKNMGETPVIPSRSTSRASSLTMSQSGLSLSALANGNSHSRHSSGSGLGGNAELAIEKAATKRLEKLNIELQKELLQQKNANREARGSTTIEADYKTKYQFAEIQIKSLEEKLALYKSSGFNSVNSGSGRNPLKDSTRQVNNLSNVMESSLLDKDAISMKQENLRLSSRLNEYQTKLKRMQISNDSTFIHQEQLAQLKSKLQVLESKNVTLQDSVNFYKDRAENYYSKIEAAEIAVQTAKRAEMLVKNELAQTKDRLSKAQEEFKMSDVMVAKLSSQVREVERDLADKVFALRQLQEQFDAMKSKHENDEEFRQSATFSQTKSKERELQMLNDDLVRLMNKETELNKMLKNVNLQLDVSKKEVRSLKFSNTEVTKENDHLKQALTDAMNRAEKLMTEKQEYSMKLTTVSSQVNALKATNSDLLKERDSLLEAKRALELKVSNITGEFEKHLAKVKLDATNAVSVVQLTDQLKKSESEVTTLKMKLHDFEEKVNGYETKMQQMREDSLMVIEENKALVKFNKNLKSKMEQMEEDYNNEKMADSKHWTSRMNELEEKLMMQNATKRDEDQKLYNLNRSIKDLQNHNDIQEHTIQRYKHEIETLEAQVTRMDATIQQLQKQDAETLLKYKRAAREINQFKEQNLLLEKELLDWRTAA